MGVKVMQSLGKWLQQRPMVLATFLLLLVVATRWLPHPPNVTPLGAVAVMSGIFFRRSKGVLVPFIALVVSDLILGSYGAVMAVVYFGFMINVWLGAWSAQQKKWRGVAQVGAVLIGAVWFYVSTNAAVWWFGSLYSHDISGLWQSYISAIPFFRNSIVGDVFYFGLLQSLWWLLQRAIIHSEVNAHVSQSSIFQKNLVQ